jgi:hypothetical protein
MLYEGMEAEGLRCIADVRERYDGRKRSPFNEAECGHHYARAMAAWAALLALEGFGYSGVDQVMRFAAQDGTFFWAIGDAWGTCTLTADGDVTLSVSYGMLKLKRFELTGLGAYERDDGLVIAFGEDVHFRVEPY